MKEKITSRKFWGFLATFIVGVLLLFNYSETTADKISALILILGDTISYIFAESQIDSAREMIKGVIENDKNI